MSDSLNPSSEILDDGQHYPSIGDVLERYTKNICGSLGDTADTASVFREQFLTLVRQFLEVVPLSERFSDYLVGNALNRCLAHPSTVINESGYPRLLAKSFMVLEQFALNLLRAPWKVEYKQIKVCTARRHGFVSCFNKTVPHILCLCICTKYMCIFRHTLVYTVISSWLVWGLS